jgi:hypothetical protein
VLCLPPARVLLISGREGVFYMWFFKRLSRKWYVLSALVSVLFSIASVYSALKPDAKAHNVYRSPYVLLERKSPAEGTVYCSGSIVSYRGHTFILTSSHLFWTMNPGNPRELPGDNYRWVNVYDARHNLLGVASLMYNDASRDIAILGGTVESYGLVHKYGSFELSPMTMEQLEDIVGEEVYFLGACEVGSWYNIKRIQPFSEKTIIARVTRSKISEGTDLPAGLDMTCIFVKGGGWYGCSGGPLLYKGKVIGVCSMLENFTPKTGTAYSSVEEVCREFLDKLPEVNAEKK